MRGKKADQEFISQFITDCTAKNIETPESILFEAKKQIEEIDNEILKVEMLKKTRSKLYDVVFLFEQNKKNKSFYDLNYDYAKLIVNSINNRVNISKFEKNNDINLTLKKMVLYKIIIRNNSNYTAGENFYSFCKEVGIYDNKS